MQGLEIFTKFGILSDKKWQVDWERLSPLMDEISEHDKNILIKLFHIGDGELRGTAMGRCAYSLGENESDDVKACIHELLLYLSIIVYEEIRHGIILKQCYHKLHDESDYIKSCDGGTVSGYLYEENKIWPTVFDIFASFLSGEVVNVELYEAVEKKIENKELAEIIRNIKLDEVRHREAWRLLHKKIYNDPSTPKHVKEQLLKSFIDYSNTHQAEIGNTYLKGAMEAQSIFGFSVSRDIIAKKHQIYSDIFGSDWPLSEAEMGRRHMAHFAKLVKESKE